LTSHFDHPPEDSCLAERKIATGPIVCDHPLFDLFQLSIAMGTFYDFLGNAVDITLEVWLPWVIGNPLTNMKAIVLGFQGTSRIASSGIGGSVGLP
jgi:hypothetical protein